MDISINVGKEFEIRYAHLWLKTKFLDFPGGPVVKNLPANAANTGSIPALGRSHMPRGN